MKMKFLVPNYSCLQNPWLGGYRRQIPVLSVLNWICWASPPPEQNSCVRHCPQSVWRLTAHQYCPSDKTSKARQLKTLNQKLNRPKLDSTAICPSGTQDTECSKSRDLLIRRSDEHREIAVFATASFWTSKLWWPGECHQLQKGANKNCSISYWTCSCTKQIPAPLCRSLAIYRKRQASPEPLVIRHHFEVELQH